MVGLNVNEEDRLIRNVLKNLPKRFSARQFAFYFLLYFPEEKADIMAHKKSGLRISFYEWLNRNYLHSLKDRYIQLVPGIRKNNRRSDKDERWYNGTNCNYLRIRYDI